MGIGIQVCGLNGSGKSTLGRALAERLGYHFIDNENLYFSRVAANEPYSNPKSRQEVENILAKEIYNHPNFVFAAVKGDFGKEITSAYNFVISVEVSREIRLQRVRERSFQRFGNRMLEGGDLYEREEAFFRMVESREDNYVEKWLETLNCPVIRIDGTKPVEENIENIIRLISLNKK